MINKNISIWRGTQPPPTNYHLWEKEDGGLYVYLDEKWQHLVTPTDKTILDEHQQQLDKIKNLSLTEIDPTDTNTYKSYQLKSDDNIFGTTINIPKGKFIKQVTLGYSNATIDTSTGNINIGTGLAKEYLLFSITLDTGNYELISINLSEFITEKDYSDGLEVVDNKLKVKVDPTSETYLKVSNNGIKVEGINTKVSNIVYDIKYNIQNGKWLPVRKGSGEDSVVIGYDDNVALGSYSQAEGKDTRAEGYCSHAQGMNTTANGNCSHAEGYSTHATTQYSHAEGYETYAQGQASHAEGQLTTVSGCYAHAQGYYNYNNESFIDMIGVGSDSRNQTNASVIYVKRKGSNDIDTNDPKNGYQYLINVGGYKGQEIGNAKSVQEVFADINSVLYTQHAHITLTVSPTIIEKGVNTVINLSWQYTYNDKITTPASMELKSGGTVLESTNQTYTDTISNTKSYQVTAVNEGVTKTSSTITVNAYYPMYFGEGSGTYNQSELITTSNKRPIASSPRGDISITFTGGKYLWLCVPNTMSVNKVTSSGFAVPMEAPVTQTINESYKCYRSTDTINKGTVNFTIS